ncbi:MAG: circadian clock protein KaiB [Anaerolineae bacterium]|nr:circadian clock protein KaiB [Anaerolineae bacterium]
MSEYLLKLYITGQTPRSQLAIANLRHICEQSLQGQYRLVIIDIQEQPQLAEDERILATPTLIKELPEPIRRIIGDLSDVDQVLFGLDLKSDTQLNNKHTGGGQA